MGGIKTLSGPLGGQIIAMEYQVDRSEFDRTNYPVKLTPDTGCPKWIQGKGCANVRKCVECGVKNELDCPIFAGYKILFPYPIETWPEWARVEKEKWDRVKLSNSKRTRVGARR